MSDYSVDVSALQADARTWTAWADELERIEERVPYVDNAIFGTVLGVDTVYTAFTKGLQTLRAYIDSGHTEFAGIADALGRSASAYAENDSELSVDAWRTARRLGIG